MSELRRELLKIVPTYALRRLGEGLVAAPENRRQVAALVHLCGSLGMTAMPLELGATECPEGTLRISLQGLRKVVELNEVSGHVLVQAGVTLAELGDYLAGRGLALGFNCFEGAREAWELALHPGLACWGAGGDRASQVKALWAVKADGGYLEGNTAPVDTVPVSWKELVLASAGAWALPVMLAFKVQALGGGSQGLVYTGALEDLLPAAFAGGDLGSAFQIFVFGEEGSGRGRWQLSLDFSGERELARAEALLAPLGGLRQVYRGASAAHENHDRRHRAWEAPGAARGILGRASLPPAPASLLVESLQSQLDAGQLAQVAFQGFHQGYAEFSASGKGPVGGLGQWSHGALREQEAPGLLAALKRALDPDSVLATPWPQDSV
jgi:hypothetical protein